jgi:hypothetical protein
MRTIYSLLVLVLITFSCSESDDFTQLQNNQKQSPNSILKLDPTKLAKIIYFPGAPYESQWVFYPNGLLKKITKHDGSIVQNFIYDANRNLIFTSHIGSNGNPAISSSFTYDNTNHITSYNGQTVTYDAAANKYIYQYVPINDYDYPDSREIILNNDLLITNEVTNYIATDGNYSIFGMSAGYFNNNMTYVIGPNDPSGPSYLYDTNVNPLKLAMLPICRAMSITNGSYSSRFATGEYNSVNNVILNSYAPEDPEKEEYVYQYNNNLPTSIIKKFYYLGVLETTSLFALYYYQGDVIP